MHDNMISQIRFARKLAQAKMPKNIEMQIQTYYQNLCHECLNAHFIDKGYYYRHNGENYLCSPIQKERADFRAIECVECHQEILLMNTGKEGWDLLFSIIPEENISFMKKKEAQTTGNC